MKTISSLRPADVLVIVIGTVLILFMAMQATGQTNDYRNAMPVAMKTPEPIQVRANSLRDLCGYDHSGMPLPFDVVLSNYFDIKSSMITNDPHLKQQLVFSLRADIVGKGYKIVEPKHKDPFEPDAYLLDVFACYDRWGYIIPVTKLAGKHKGTGTVVGDDEAKTTFHHDID